MVYPCITLNVRRGLACELEARGIRRWIRLSADSLQLPMPSCRHPPILKATILVSLVVGLSAPALARVHLLDREQIRWTLDLLQSHDWGVGSAMKRFLEDFETRARNVPANIKAYGAADFIAEDFTVHNPLFWRAVFEAGEDRVLLFWLHGLLLEQEKRFLDAFEWTVMVRRGVILSEEFDDRWLRWEKNLLTNTVVGDVCIANPRGIIYRRPDFRASIMVRLRQMTEGRPPPEIMEWVYQRRAETPAAQAYHRLIWQRWETQLQENTLPVNVREVVLLRAGYWPNFPSYAADELIILAAWMAHQGDADFALMCWLNAASVLVDPPAFNPEALLVPLTGMSLRDDQPSFSRAKSRFGLTINWADFVAQDSMVHPMLRWNAIQTLRRVEGYGGNLEGWRLNQLWFTQTVAQSSALQGCDKRASKAIRDIQMTSRARPIGDFELLRWAIWSDVDVSAERTIGRVLKRNRQNIKEPFNYTLAALGEGRWAEVARGFREIVDQSEGNAGSFVFWSAIAETVAHDDLPAWLTEDRLDKVNDPWVRLLCRALMEKTDRQIFLKKARSYTDFGSIARIAEAHMALAFGPGSSIESTRADLTAVLETGRVDLIAFLVAARRLSETGESLDRGPGTAGGEQVTAVAKVAAEGPDF